MAGLDDLPQVDPRRGVVLDATSEFALAIRTIRNKYGLSFVEVTRVVSSEMAFLAQCEMVKNKQEG
jgi:hypothetical protein